MRFVTFTTKKKETHREQRENAILGGVLHAGGIVGLDELGQTSILHAFIEYCTTGINALKRMRAQLAGIGKPKYRNEDVTYWAPILNPHLLAFTGLNDRLHAQESGMLEPKQPVWFDKMDDSITGHEQPIILPSGSSKVDFEVELGLVIGIGGRNIPESAALQHVFGCMCVHDVSARDWQLERDGKQWWIGKTPETFTPCGPCIVTLDELGDIHNLSLTLRLNGEVMQQGNTGNMIFPPERLIAHLSQHVRLRPGDIISCGTPSGIGHARKPPVYLKPGDVCEVEISGIGVLRNPVVAAAT